MNPAGSSGSVAIIGGGITGLTAAFRLMQAGVPVTLYEADQRVGGVIRSVQESGYLAEFGPNSILETSPKISGLIRDLGLEPRRGYSDPGAENRYLVRGGKPVCLPASPLRFFGTKLFSTGAKLRLLREPFLRRAPADKEENVAEFVLRRLGREWLDYAINPMIAGIYAGDPRRLSVIHAFPRLHAVEQRYGSLILGQILGARERKRRGEVSKQEAKKISFDQGLQVLTDTLEARLRAAIRLNTTVTALERAPRGWTVSVQSGGSEDAFEHRAVLLAAPAHCLARIALNADAGLTLAPLAEVYYPPVASVVLGFRRADVAHPLDGFGMLVPEVEKFRILGTLFSSSLFPNRAPDGHVTLTTYVGGVRAPDLALRPIEELFNLTLTDLATILGVRGSPTFRHAVLYRQAIPQYEVGYGRFKTLMETIETRASGIFLAGHYRNGISLGDSIIAGHDVADRIAAFARAWPA
ncbi:MAG TPA: protoporphyrinogen oxidase [Verrucomicrobiota bacterium]|nr:protoporphyrinogen oxidase [Verrucomicrobiota bacterium]HRZ36189.1 protoporphyrinogen oxidase [Candidatus Paceibacterota bacterium]HRZ58649.1 protoporphyrinogen oxidase [Candidatus Paceibacterota bacterium]